jgi:molecular chaperone HscB
VTEKVQATIAALQAAFSTDPPDLSEAKSLTVQLRYWLGLEAAAKEWTPETGAGGSAGSSFTHS